MVRISAEVPEGVNYSRGRRRITWRWSLTLLLKKLQHLFRVIADGGEKAMFLLWKSVNLHWLRYKRMFARPNREGQANRERTRTWAAVSCLGLRKRFPLLPHFCGWAQHQVCAESGIFNSSSRNRWCGGSSHYLWLLMTWVSGGPNQDMWVQTTVVLMSRRILWS